MDTMVDVLVMRFAVMALVAVVLALGAWATIAFLRRRGLTDQARAGVDHILRLAAVQRGRGGDRGIRGALADAALRRLGGPRGQR